MTESKTQPDSNGDMLVCAWRMDGDGGAAPLTGGEAAPVAPQFDWFHIDITQDSAEDWLKSQPDLPDFAITALMAEETRPRFEPWGECALINMRGVNHNPGAEPEDMVSIRMWVTPTRIITSRRRKLQAVSDLRASIDGGEAPVTPGDLIALLALRISMRIEPVIAELVDVLDDLEDAVFDEGETVERMALAQPRSEAAQIRRHIAPQREAMRALAIAKAKWMREEDRRDCHEAAEAMARLSEDLDALRERAIVLNDLLVSHQADRMNSHMMVLSVIAGVFLPVSLIAGMMGMNVGGMPLVDSAAGFWVVSAILLVICVIEFAFFKWAKWL